LSELDAALAPALTAPLTAPIVGEIGRRLELIAAAAADYLTLARSAESLSTGETQRLRLAAALASSLVGALYILDEPSAGLHERDVERLTPLLERLRDLGNTVVVVEHHPAVMQTADWVVDLGPGAAEEGGRVVYQGPTAGLRDVEDSLTGAYLFGRVSLAPAGKRRTPTAWLHLKGARLHNLQDVAVNFPLGVLCVVAGVSGAGKSALVEDTLYPLLARHKHTKDAAAPPPGATLEGASQVGEVVLIKPEAPPRSARSNPATYLKVFDDIRSLFAATTEAKIRNFGPGHFSFNQPGGRCETCEGQGTLAVDMQFLADVTMTCPECQGTRYKREVLAIKVRSLSVAEVLDLSVREAFRFFRAQPAVQHRLKRLIDVGLEYVRLGQSMDTLSSGEAQRLRLAGHFAAARKPRGLFILIEPAAGLHPADVETLTTCFHDLLATGQSLLVVEHNLNVIRTADHVIELGPGAGPAGGQVVAQGTPEAIAANPASATGRYLQADGPGPPP
jgi:excinuclease ABC subunit A